MNPNIVWGALFAAGGAYEIYAIFNRRNGDTLSERVRSLFHVKTKTGKVVFSLAWLTFSAWFLIHIIQGG